MGRKLQDIKFNEVFTSEEFLMATLVNCSVYLESAAFDLIKYEKLQLVVLIRLHYLFKRRKITERVL